MKRVADRAVYLVLVLAACASVVLSAPNLAARNTTASLAAPEVAVHVDRSAADLNTALAYSD